MDTKTLLERVSARAAISRDMAAELLDVFAITMSERLSDGDSVAFPGFGTFETKKRAERINVHPSSGKRMLIPPKIVVSFKPSALLKQKLNKKE